jgi:outer membrane protein assembly factor BamD
LLTPDAFFFEVSMLRRIPVVVLLSALTLTIACTNKKVTNPLANVGSKQPDKVLFDRAMDALKHNRFDVARITLETLINTYPDSEFVARAKLGVADSWYAEGGTAAMAQAELQYNDFKTFFPNMPEAAEAQLKIANIHYQQMEKPDRDYTHALRAEQEYRNLIQEFPDSKLLPTAKQRLMEVQEVLAQREFEVGRFYYLRQSYAASTARLKSLVEQYPLYSKADEALYMLGQIREAEITATRARPVCIKGNPEPGCMPEDMKGRFIEKTTQEAAESYSHILTRYPAMNRADDAKARLIALHQPVPRPTKAALAQNKAEEDSRRESPLMTKVLRNFSKHPDVAQAAHVGEPTMVDPEPVSATSVMREANSAMMGNSGADKNKVSVEVGGGALPADGTVPRSDAPTAATTAADPSSADPSSATPASATPTSATPASATGDTTAPPAQPSGNQPTPNGAPDANELTPNVPSDSGQALPPPPQINEIQSGADAKTDASAASSGDAGSQPASDQEISSSKHKKKKGLKAPA